MELPVAGVDVVEVSPPYDHAEVTAYLANRVVLEALSGIAWRRHSGSATTPRRHPEDPLLEGRGGVSPPSRDSRSVE
jgi:agmatinase